MSAAFLAPETYLTRTIIFEGEERLLHGKADYATWYGNGAMDTNTVVDVWVFRVSVLDLWSGHREEKDLVKYRNRLAHEGNVVEDVEAKRNGLAQSGIAQCLAYMDIVAEIRKDQRHKNAAIYGCTTDSHHFAFLPSYDSRYSTNNKECER